MYSFVFSDAANQIYDDTAKQGTHSNTWSFDEKNKSKALGTIMYNIIITSMKHAIY